MGLIEEKDTVNDVIDVDISPIKKKRFRINGDNNKILELNVSDTTIIKRIPEAEKKLKKLAEEATSFTDDELKDNSADGLETFSKKLDSIDSKMRTIVDGIFNAPVSAVCADDGSMYDPFDGQFRFEYIIEKIIALYEENITVEYSKLHERVKKHTSKYIK
jgi:hypothetical protein